MSKKLKLLAIALGVAGLLAISFAGVALADNPATTEEAWGEMHQACENGDFETMAEWHTQCDGEESPMGGGMMGGGMMGGWR